ncbi:MAG: hypothetical protein J07HB67_00642 [halophilic archaeon J07HB67]|nr:MAG: hypothetical protein J07HB67_00642 [halophilic archaeon J07HB67]
MIAPEKLRTELALADDDTVTVRIVEVGEPFAAGGES